MERKRRRVYTHQSVDLDAVASLWLYLRFVCRSAEIMFVSANWDGAGLEPGDVALDIKANGHGVKGELRGGVRHSCFATLAFRFCNMEDLQALTPIISFVDAQDAHGDAYDYLATEMSVGAAQTLSCTGINAVLRALQSVFPNDDRMVTERMFEIFDGFLKNGRGRLAAEEEATHAVIVDGRVAVLSEPRHSATTYVLLKQMRYDAVIYRRGMNIGIRRRRGVEIRMDHPLIRAVIGDEEGWFFHEAGFATSHGGRKAPATKPSKVDPMMLAHAVAAALQNEETAAAAA